MPELEDLEASLKELRRKFLEIIQDLRPDLHKYCSRMTGSVLDGEDMVQETLAQAYYKLSLLQQDIPLRPWLFKIAHNKCVDFLRRRRQKFVSLEEETEISAIPPDEIERQEMVSQALSTLVYNLPPKERACIILKDVLGYSLLEISEILETSITAVKAALHRGRQKLKTAKPVSRASVSKKSDLLRRYIDLFNNRDWEGVIKLLRSDVHCEVVGDWTGLGRDAAENHYFFKYAHSAPQMQWRLSLAEVDGEQVLVCWKKIAGQWEPSSFVRIEWEENLVKSIRDYMHIPYLFETMKQIGAHNLSGTFKK